MQEEHPGCPIERRHNIIGDKGWTCHLPKNVLFARPPQASPHSDFELHGVKLGDAEARGSSVLTMMTSSAAPPPANKVHHFCRDGSAKTHFSEDTFWTILSHEAVCLYVAKKTSRYHVRRRRNLRKEATMPTTTEKTTCGAPRPMRRTSNVVR